MTVVEWMPFKPLGHREFDNAKPGDPANVAIFLLPWWEHIQ
jgi:hypothetical protein